MSALAVTAEAFVEMAHRIVWATVATVDDRDRLRSRILHPPSVTTGLRVTTPVRPIGCSMTNTAVGVGSVQAGADTGRLRPGDRATVVGWSHL